MNNFYAIFHANLAFSAIEESEIPIVIDNCYFPLLNLIEKNNLPIAIELSGYTLEKIKALRPQWIIRFLDLYNKQLIELVGSGYIQLIGPLVPYEVNIKNQRLGLEAYQDILSTTPQIAFVNEQTFSKSLVDVYAEVGYESIAMEWNNAFSKHLEWDKSFSYSPVMVKGINSSLPILWTDSIIFQYFQRTAHGEYTIEEYLNLVKKLIDDGNNNIPVYCSDLEIFNFRPGRFETEISMGKDEWAHIQEIFIQLSSFGLFQLPSALIKENCRQDIYLDLSSAESPILVKKQTKYSLSRWAACGRGASYINHLCYQYFKQIEDSNESEKWKKLLQYWGSDFRTHITLKKWQKAIDYLSFTSEIMEAKVEHQDITQSIFTIEENDKQILIRTKDFIFSFLRLKGLCLEIVMKNDKKLPFGTIKHGEFDHIGYGADFYTGTTVIESAGIGHITDLVNVKNYNIKIKSEHELELSTEISLKEIGKVKKNWTIDLINNELTFDAELFLYRQVHGSIRMGTLTLLARDVEQSFSYKLKNGGKDDESFLINKLTRIEHHKAQSLLQSSQNGLGLTDGHIEFVSLKGENEESKLVSLHLDRNKSYPFVMLQNDIVHNEFLTRLFFSLQEIDDTSRENNILHHRLSYSISI